jgi:hypothetical protein
MENDYLCPKCKGHLKIKKSIVFAAKTPSGERGLIFLSPEIGDYHITKHPEFKIKEGAHIEFFCPICHENLEAKSLNDNLAKIILKDKKGIEHDILFSEIVGEKCTYVIYENRVDSFGKDAEHYVNFFGAGSDF